MSNIDILIEALKNIQRYDREGSGICPYGCDTPYIAKKALVDYGNAEYVSQPADSADEAIGECHCESLAWILGPCVNCGGNPPLI